MIDLAAVQTLNDQLVAARAWRRQLAAAAEFHHALGPSLAPELLLSGDISGSGSGAHGAGDGDGSGGVHMEGLAAAVGALAVTEDESETDGSPVKLGGPPVAAAGASPAKQPSFSTAALSSSLQSLRRATSARAVVGAGPPTSTSVPLPLDVGAFCVPLGELIRASPRIRMLQERVGAVNERLCEIDEQIATLRGLFRPLGHPERREGLAALLNTEGEQEVIGAAASADVEEGIERLGRALVEGAGGASSLPGSRRSSDAHAPSQPLPPGPATAAPSAASDFSPLLALASLLTSPGLPLPPPPGVAPRGAGGGTPLAEALFPLPPPSLHPCAKWLPLLLLRRGSVTGEEILSEPALASLTAAASSANATGRLGGNDDESGGSPLASLALLLLHGVYVPPALAARALSLPAALAPVLSRGAGLTATPLEPASLTLASFAVGSPGVLAASGASGPQQPQQQSQEAAGSSESSNRSRASSAASTTVGRLAGPGPLPPLCRELIQLHDSLRTARRVSRGRAGPQRDFARIVCDQRTREGRLLQRWCHRVLAGIDAKAKQQGAADGSKAPDTPPVPQAAAGPGGNGTAGGATGTTAAKDSLLGGSLVAALQTITSPVLPSLSLSAAAPPTPSPPAAGGAPKQGPSALPVGTTGPGSAPHDAGEYAFCMPALLASADPGPRYVRRVLADTGLPRSVVTADGAVLDVFAMLGWRGRAGGGHSQGLQRAGSVEGLQRAPAGGTPRAQRAPSAPATPSTPARPAPAAAASFASPSAALSPAASRTAPPSAAKDLSRATAGGNGARSVAATTAPAPAGSLPTPRTVAAFLRYFTQEVAAEYGLTGGGVPEQQQPQPGGDGAARPHSTAVGAPGAASAEAVRLLRGFVDRAVFPRLRALLLRGPDLVYLHTDSDGCGAEEDDCDFDGASPGYADASHHSAQPSHGRAASHFDMGTVLPYGAFGKEQRRGDDDEDDEDDVRESAALASPVRPRNSGVQQQWRHGSNSDEATAGPLPAVVHFPSSLATSLLAQLRVPGSAPTGPASEASRLALLYSAEAGSGSTPMASALLADPTPTAASDDTGAGATAALAYGSSASHEGAASPFVSAVRSAAATTASLLGRASFSKPASTATPDSLPTAVAVPAAVIVSPRGRTASAVFEAAASASALSASASASAASGSAFTAAHDHSEASNALASPSPSPSPSATSVCPPSEAASAASTDRRSLPPETLKLGMASFTGTDTPTVSPLPQLSLGAAASALSEGLSPRIASLQEQLSKRVEALLPDAAGRAWPPQTDASGATAAIGASALFAGCSVVALSQAAANSVLGGGIVSTSLMTPPYPLSGPRAYSPPVDAPLPPSSRVPRGSPADVILRRDRIWARKRAAAEGALTPAELGVPAGLFHPLPSDVVLVPLRVGAPATGGDGSSDAPASSFDAGGLTLARYAYPPYNVASQLLTAIGGCEEPREMLALLQAAVQATVAEAGARGRAAKAAAGSSSSTSALAADDLIPLLTYAAAHSRWARPHADLAFMSTYGIPPGSGGGQEAYLTTLATSCVAYVCTQSHSTHGHGRAALAASGPAQLQGARGARDASDSGKGGDNGSGKLALSAPSASSTPSASGGTAPSTPVKPGGTPQQMRLGVDSGHFSDDEGQDDDASDDADAAEYAAATAAAAAASSAISGSVTAAGTASDAPAGSQALPLESDAALASAQVLRHIAEGVSGHATGVTSDGDEDGEREGDGAGAGGYYGTDDGATGDDAHAYAELLAEDDGGASAALAGGEHAAAAGNSDITALKGLLRDQDTLEGVLRMFV